MCAESPRSGFSLVELSIVISIVGLLIGGTLAARALIEQSKLSSAMTGVEKVRSAYLNFMTRYDAIPGDFNGAERYWSACVEQTVGKYGVNSCNGNGDRLIKYTSSESLRAWQHLTLAGVYPGSYTGEWTGSSSGMELGVNVPSTTIDATAIDVNHYERTSDQTYLPVYGRMGNSLQFSSIADWSGAVFTPQQSLTIDKKWDDAVPSAGIIRVSTSAGETVDCTTARETTLSSEYILANEARTCRMWIFGFGD